MCVFVCLRSSVLFCAWRLSVLVSVYMCVCVYMCSVPGSGKGLQTAEHWNFVASILFSNRVQQSAISNHQTAHQ